jgi:sarcosine oxidase subunit gamma
VADIWTNDLTGFGLASVMLRQGAGADALGAALGFAVPAGPMAGGDGALVLWGTGPGHWLAYSDATGPDWADGLGDHLAGMAAVVDQSGAYVLIELGGADARAVLQSGLPVDLMAPGLAPGAVWVSAIAHIGVIVHWAAPDRYHLAVFRSFATSFREWLDHAIAAL